MKKMRFINGLTVLVLGLSLGMTACKKEGCTDPLASNYSEKANHDDGTCLYNGLTQPPGESIIIEEDIDAPTTWSSSVVKICGDIRVNAALTINPGVTIVACAGASLEVMESGSIYAVGTATSPILFKGEVSSKGYWSGISVRSNNPNNQFNYVTVSDAGSYWFWEYSNVHVATAAQLSIQNSTFGNSNKHGLFVVDDALLPVFANNTFSNNQNAGLNISARLIGSIDAASNYNSANGENFIHVRGGTVGTTQTWPSTNAPYLIVSDVTVNGGLTISAGATVLFETTAGIDIMETGYLSAVGTASLPITFTGRYTSPGYWSAINIRSNNPNNKMNYVTLNDGGSYWFYEYSSLSVSGRLEMDNCAISNSNSWAMRVGGSAQIICSGAVQTTPEGITAYNNLSGNGLGADADCVGGGCTVLFE